MRKIGFIGAYDKTDLILYLARILVATGKRVLVVDGTILQKARYIVPAIKPANMYVTEFEGIDVAVGFQTYNQIKTYLGMPEHADLGYDIAMIDADNIRALSYFELETAEQNYFVTSFEAYPLKKGIEILNGLQQVLKMTKILFSRTASKEEEEYLNYLSLGSKVEWEEEKIYFPFEIGDQSIIAENQRVSKIKYKRLSSQYKEALIYIAEKILGQSEYGQLKRTFRQLERGV